MATNRVSSSGNRDHAVGEEAAAPAAGPNHTYHVSSNGITPTNPIECKVGQTFQFTGTNIPVEAKRGNVDSCEELFNVSEITVGSVLYSVQPNAKGKEYRIIAITGSILQANSSSDPHGTHGDANGGGTVGTIKVGST